jgi:hypothetical protein
MKHGWWEPILFNLRRFIVRFCKYLFSIYAFCCYLFIVVFYNWSIFDTNCFLICTKTALVKCCNITCVTWLRSSGNWYMSFYIENTTVHINAPMSSHMCLRVFIIRPVNVTAIITIFSEYNFLYSGYSCWFGTCFCCKTYPLTLHHRIIKW